MTTLHESWGRWGKEPPCEHLLKLRDLLIEQGLTVWAKYAEPNGWVKVHCKTCHKMYETTLQPDTNGVWTDTDT